MRHYLNQKNLIHLYYVFFYSQILYGILGWGCASQIRKRPIQNPSEQSIKNYQQNFLERQNNEQHIVLQI